MQLASHWGLRSYSQILDESITYLVNATVMGDEITTSWHISSPTPSCTHVGRHPSTALLLPAEPERGFTIFTYNGATLLS